MLKLTAAKALAESLPGVSEVSVTSYAAYAHGADLWVCGQRECLKITPASENPLSQQLCECGAILTP